MKDCEQVTSKVLLIGEDSKMFSQTVKAQGFFYDFSIPSRFSLFS